MNNSNYLIDKVADNVSSRNLLFVLPLFPADTDECVIDNGGCFDVCANTVGSFHCSCREGFVFAADKFSCVGEFKIVYSHLAITRTIIMSVNLVNHRGIQNPIVFARNHVHVCPVRILFIQPVICSMLLLLIHLLSRFASIIFDYNSIFAVTALIMSAELILYQRCTVDKIHGWDYLLRKMEQREREYNKQQQAA